MVKRTTDTSAYELLPQGEYVFRVVSVKEMESEKKPGMKFFKWTFEYMTEEETLDWTTLMFKSRMGDLLKALGATEVAPNKYEWDDAEILGKMVKCNIVHDKGNDGRMREVMLDIVPFVPEKTAGEKAADEVAWDEGK